MTIRTALGRVKGLGSAKSGVMHWWWQRVTAILIIPFGLWFAYSLLNILPAADIKDVQAWVAEPMHTISLVLLMGAMFYHAKLGGQVVIEDYVHHKGLKFFMLFMNAVMPFAMALIGIVSVLKLHFAGVAA